MRFLRELGRETGEVAIFPGAFHPPTVAHVALAGAARNHVQEVVWAMPEAFPHKTYEGVGREQRLRMVMGATEDAVAVSRENLYFAVAAELSAAMPGVKISILTGEDSARRILEWDYGEGEVWKREYLHENLQSFPILTTRRGGGGGNWVVPKEFASYFRWLEMSSEQMNMMDISSRAVRDRIASGVEWRELVPEALWEAVSKLYGSSGSVSGQ